MPTTFEVSLDDDLADRIRQAAKARAITEAELIRDCVAQQLDTATRHKAALDRLDIVDQALIDLAQYIGEATAAPPADATSFCRYSPPKP